MSTFRLLAVRHVNTLVPYDTPVQQDEQRGAERAANTMPAEARAVTFSRAGAGWCRALCSASGKGLLLYHVRR